MDDQQAREYVARVEAALTRIETLSDPQAQETALEALQGMLELYGEGIARMIGVVARAGDGSTLSAFSEDELISHLMMLHDLHPTSMTERVESALEEVRPSLASHGGDVELLGIENGVVALRLKGSCGSCPSSALTLKSTVEDAIYKAAPDVMKIESEGASADAPAANGFIPLASVH